MRERQIYTPHTLVSLSAFFAEPKVKKGVGDSENAKDEGSLGFEAFFNLRRIACLYFDVVRKIKRYY